MELRSSLIGMLILIWQKLLWKVFKNLWLSLTEKQRSELVLKKRENVYTDLFNKTIARGVNNASCF